MNHIEVLNGLARFIKENGRAPTVRELKQELGYFATGQLYQYLIDLEAAGVIRWPKDRFGKRKARGIELLVPLKGPHQIPIVGTIGNPPDFVPGEKWVEVHDDGRITVDGQTWQVVVSEIRQAHESEKQEDTGGDRGFYSSLPGMEKTLDDSQSP